MVGDCLLLQKDPRAMESNMKVLKIRQELLGDHDDTAISYHQVGQLGGAWCTVHLLVTWWGDSLAASATTPQTRS